jgi:predicted RNase H-like nuclease (RuvC/YqgF family)
MLLLSSVIVTAAPAEVPKGFEKLPDGRYAIEEEMVIDIGNTIVDLQTRIEILKEENKALRESLEKERNKVAEIEKEFKDFKVAQNKLNEKKDERIDNLLELTQEQGRTIVRLNENFKLEKLKWAGGGTLAGAFVGLAVALGLSQ